MNYYTVEDILKYTTLKEQQDYAQSLMHWVKLFRDGALSDKFSEQIAALLELNAKDIIERDWINCRWHVEDVLDIRPYLTREQARDVLRKVGDNHNAELGINWDVLEAWASEMYPEN